MMAPTHRMGGLLTGITVVNCINSYTTVGGMIAIIPGTIIGCYLCDIDNGNSRISYRWKIVRFFVAAGQMLIRIIAFFLPQKQKKYVLRLIGHRGLFHSLFMVLLCTAPIIVAGICTPIFGSFIIGYGIGIGLGMLSHITLDALSGGVNPLLPFSDKPVVLAQIKTGGFIEWLLLSALTIITAIVTIHMLPVITNIFRQMI